MLVRTYARLLSTHDQIWVMFRHVGGRPKECTLALSTFDYTALQRSSNLIQRQGTAK